MTLNAAQFLSRLSGEGEDKAIKLLEQHGYAVQVQDTGKVQFIVKERAKAELFLRSLKQSGITRVEYAKKSEWLDRLVLWYETERVTLEEFKDRLQVWYTQEEEPKEVIAVPPPRVIETAQGSEEDEQGMGFLDID